MRVALIGLGEAGFTLHLPALKGLAGATLAGACDLDAARRERAAKNYAVPVFADFDVMLREAKPEVVIVATPPDTHVEYCLRSLASRAHVICEKPFVPGVDDADRVLDAAARVGRQMAVNHQFREMPIFRAVRDDIRRRGIDSLRFAQAWQLFEMPPATEAGWRGRMRHRTLYEAGVHLVDYVVELFGCFPVAVQAAVSSGGRGTVPDAVVSVTLEFPGGRLAQITQNRVSKAPRQYFEVRADVPDASLRASFGGRTRLSAGMHRGAGHMRLEFGFSGLAWSETARSHTILARNPRSPMVAATRELLARTLAAFRTGAEPPTSGRAAREILGVIAACYRSAETGRRVRLDDPSLLTHAIRLGQVASG